ncbi:hypothetical protein [Paenibacillus dendritiformis]|uniref:hypothetical protein n=1 Tax=Paenibacillus dendritiformis TaxID=130049 RepID=UPI00387E2094
MKLGTSWAKLEEMKVMAQGHPERIAKYSMAKRQYDETVAEFFNEEDGVSFISTPSLRHVEEFEERAKSGTERDKVRAIIIRDRYEALEGEKTKHIELRTTQQELLSRIDGGEKLTQADVNAAYRLARLNPSDDNRVLYSRVKREFENPTEKQPTTPVQEKVTREMVEAAAGKARATGSVRDNAAYAVLKRQYESQE